MLFGYLGIRQPFIMGITVIEQSLDIFSLMLPIGSSLIFFACLFLVSAPSGNSLGFVLLNIMRPAYRFLNLFIRVFRAWTLILVGSWTLFRDPVW